MGLVDEIDEMMRKPIEQTAIGMAGWVGGPQGAVDEVGAISPDALRLFELMFAVATGQNAAIKRLAGEIEALR